MNASICLRSAIGGGLEGSLDTRLSVGATVVPTHAIAPAALCPWAMGHRGAQMAGRKVRSTPLRLMPTE